MIAPKIMCNNYHNGVEGGVGWKVEGGGGRVNIMSLD